MVLLVTFQTVSTSKPAHNKTKNISSECAFKCVQRFCFFVSFFTLKPIKTCDPTEVSHAANEAAGHSLSPLPPSPSINVFPALRLCASEDYSLVRSLHFPCVPRSGDRLSKQQCNKMLIVRSVWGFFSFFTFQFSCRTICEIFSIPG